MIETIYIEENILQHPRVIEIVARFPQARTITCGRYGEVFNPKAQNFRLQKLKPALILAEKYKHFALEVPDRLWHWGKTKLLFFAHAQLFIRLPLLFFTGHVSISQLCAVC